MKTNYLKMTWRVLLCLAALTGCVEEEEDYAGEIGKESTILEGKVSSLGGEPLAGVTVRVDYFQGTWLSHYKTRHKAEVKTDQTGKYRLFFNIQEDELKKEEGVTRYYTLTYDMSNLDPKRYLLLTDNRTVSNEPGKATSCSRSYYDLERGKSYTDNLYVSRRKDVRVTLKGVTRPQQEFGPPLPDNYFALSLDFPYGNTQPAEVLEGASFVSIPYLQVEHDQEKTLLLPLALGEENLITLERMKEGVRTCETIHLHASEEMPQELTYEF